MSPGRIPRVLFRAPPLLFWLGAGFLLAGLWRLRFGPSWFNAHSGRGLIRFWLRHLNRILGLHVRVEGSAPIDSGLLVANHISWLDIPALAPSVPGRFLAKAEVGSWPVLGGLAGVTGTFFLKRHSLAAMRAVLQSLVAELCAGRTCIVFPEGTSTDGGMIRPFFPAFFQTAIEADVPVQAVVLRYVRDGGRDPVAPFIGEMSFLAHLVRILGCGRTDVVVTFSSPFRAEGHDRQFLARRSQRWIAVRLGAGGEPVNPRGGEAELDGAGAGGNRAG